MEQKKEKKKENHIRFTLTATSTSFLPSSTSQSHLKNTLHDFMHTATHTYRKKQGAAGMILPAVTADANCSARTANGPAATGSVATRSVATGSAATGSVATRSTAPRHQSSAIT
ncbi:hypothetical protein AB3S75_023850 [Citrus x aurantiifolia]